jgi:hypothetical protein
MLRQTIPVIVIFLFGVSWAIAEPPETPPVTALLRNPQAVTDAGKSSRSIRISSESDLPAQHELFGNDRPGGSEPGEHPLLPVLRWARERLSSIEELKDYSATLVKRERVNGALGKRQGYFIKIRHQPFSVYTRGLAPVSIKGQEAIYVAGRNDGKLWAHPAGLQGNLVHSVSLKPDGAIAMREQRYPITEIGILNMFKHLVAVAEQDIHHNECQVRYFAGGTINDRVCTWFQVVHPVPRRFFRFHIAQVFVDDALKIPVRYVAYSWPSEPGGPPEMLEEYTYLDLKPNNGFTDEDFSIENPAYHFR